MASFTETINPVNAPDFGSKSRAVDIQQGIKPQGVQRNEIMPEGVQQGDKSAAYAGEAEAAGIKAGATQEGMYADLFKNVVATTDFLGKAGVELTKKTIEDKVYQVADAERQKYTDILEKVKAGVGTRNVLDANAQMTDDDAANQPPDVAGLPDRLSSLTGARDSGKISGSYYQAQLLAAAKDLRAQYPGFREYIDQTFSKVTGTNPANAYISSMVQDINRATSATASSKNKMLSYIMQNGDTIPNQPEVYKAYNAGLMTDEQVLALSHPYQAMKGQLNMSNMIFQNKKLSEEDRTKIAGDNIDRAIGMNVNMAVQTLNSKIGLNSVDDVRRLEQNDKAGNLKAEDWNATLRTAVNMRRTLQSQMIADADAHGYTASVGGKGALNQKITDGLKPLDDFIASITSKDFGGLYDTQRQLTARNDTTKMGLLNNPKLGPWLSVNQAFKDTVGEQNLTKFNLDNIKGSFSDDLSNYFTTFQKNIMTQYNMKSTGVPLTFNDAITALKEQKVSNGKFNEEVLKTVDKIEDKTLPEAARLNIAQGAFSPENRKMISRLQPDTVDKNGRTVSPQTSVFLNWTSEAKTKAMFELGKKDPEVWKNYVNWAQETAANELMNKEINGLKNIPNDSGVQVGWDAKNKRLVANDTMDPAARAASNQARGGQGTAFTNYYQQVNSSVNRINSVIGNLKNIATASGGDIDTFVLKTIADSAGPEALQNVNGIPYKLMRDMGLARMNFMNNGR